MARIGLDEADKYGKSGFFSLKENGDTANARVMLMEPADLQTYVVHEVELNGVKRYVDCLRTYDQPTDVCPLCAEGAKVVVKMFIPMYMIDTGEVLIWERGKTFKAKIQDLMNQFDPIVSTIFEIERKGEANDPKTKYEFYEIETDAVTLDDLPDIPEILGGLVLKKTEAEIVEFLNTGEFPGEDTPQEAPPQRRGAGANQQKSETPPRRRGAGAGGQTGAKGGQDSAGTNTENPKAGARRRGGKPGEKF